MGRIAIFVLAFALLDEFVPGFEPRSIGSILCMGTQDSQDPSTLPKGFQVAARNYPVMASRKAIETREVVRTGEKAFRLSACAGEYEPVSALVYAAQAVSGFTVMCSELTAVGSTIPGSSVDVKIVKSWFQGNPRGIVYSAQKWLVPELLLKDDALVKVDLRSKTNYLRSTGPDGSEAYFICSNLDSSSMADVRPRDADSLQPLDLAAGEIREFWITVHVPVGAVPGTYDGIVTFSSNEGATGLPIHLTVHPFVLLPSRLTYSLYYRGVLSIDGAPTIGSESKSEVQYHAEMEDLKAHGVLYPTNYQGRDERILLRMLQIRRDASLPTDSFFNLGFIVGRQAVGEIPALKAEVEWWLQLLRPYGYVDVFFYGFDEGKDETLRLERPLWQACQEVGGKTLVACYHGAFEIAGNALDIAVLSGALDPNEARKWHSIGSRIFCYGNPQVGVEDPAIYRRNYGLALLKAGYDGEMDYAYQHGFTHIWNDFDNQDVRDHVFAYPTMNGVVDTIAWEGFREGVDDVRYASTLEAAIAAAPADKKAVAEQAHSWLELLRPESVDPDAAREQMIGWIEKLL